MANREYDQMRSRQDVDYGDDYRPASAYRQTPWQTPGPFTGVGPKGYQRSDERIREDIIDRLTMHGHIDASGIEMDIENGEVTLRGTVNSRSDKRLAEDITEGILGVRDIHNQIRVRRLTSFRGEIGYVSLRGQIFPGMDVIGSDGNRVGSVKEVRPDDILVDRPLARDVYIPFDAVKAEGGQVHLNVRSDEIDQQDWKNPQLVNLPETGSENRY